MQEAVKSTYTIFTFRNVNLPQSLTSSLAKRIWKKNTLSCKQNLAQGKAQSKMYLSC